MCEVEEGRARPGGEGVAVGGVCGWDGGRGAQPEGEPVSDDSEDAQEKLDEALFWLDDLQRCDGFNPCGDCDRCTEGGRPWKEAHAEWASR